jgi:hypothetical protein
MGAGILSAQFGRSGGDTYRATITGSRGDNGKCTIEVEVDGTAEVEISGQNGRIRTLAGQPSTWRRMECSDPLPRNPSDFRFRGIDGRGDVNLIRDPRQNRGVAVVRINDPDGGREGYTFDLEWSGNSGNSGNLGNDRYDNDRYDNDRNRDRRRGNDRFDNRSRNRGSFNNQSYRVTCSSNGNRRTLCEADTDRGVRLIRGNNACREGSTWGYNRDGIWVERGCSGQFEVGR